MRADLIVKSLLVAIIVFAAYKLLTGRGMCSGSSVQPFAFERYMNDSDAEDDYEEDEDEEDEDAEEDEEDEDEEDEHGEVEGFSNAAPTARGTLPMGPAMNLASDLLPKPSMNSKYNFGEFAPKSLLGQNFLDAKKYIGVDTQGSSLRNANYDLRSNPAIPRRDVGPWSQSTIDGDLFRKPLE